MKRAPAAHPAAPYLLRLRQGNGKVTQNRMRVLLRFLEEDRPWTLRSLHRKLSQSARCDLSSVYRALEALRAAGVLEEFRLPGDRQTHYSLRSPEPRPARGHSHHHHIVCRDCGKVSHLEMCLPAGWMDKAEGKSGFRITEHHLEFKGLCMKCQ